MAAVLRSGESHRIAQRFFPVGLQERRSDASTQIVRPKRLHEQRVGFGKPACILDLARKTALGVVFHVPDTHHTPALVGFKFRPGFALCLSFLEAHGHLRRPKIFDLHRSQARFDLEHGHLPLSIA